MNDEQARSLISDVSTTINELIIQKNKNWLEAHELRVERDKLLVENEQLKKQLATAAKLGEHDDKESFDWAALGKIDDLEQEVERLKSEINEANDYALQIAGIALWFCKHC